MFIREGLLDPLTTALLNVTNTRQESSSAMTLQILSIILVFAQVSQSDNHVRLEIGTRKVVRSEFKNRCVECPSLTCLHPTGLLRVCDSLEPEHLVILLKALKHLSMNVGLLDVLQQANTIDILVRILGTQDQNPYSTVWL